MLEIRKILAPTDFSENAKTGLDYARGLANVFGSEITLIHVTEPRFSYAGYGLSPEVVRDIERETQEAIEEQIEKAKADLGEVRCSHLVREGAPFHEIVEAAREIDADLIVMATHGHTGIKHLLLGSTAEKVVRYAPCPVLTVRAAEARTD